jgi:uncharacterized protein (DUF2141 family)
MKLRTCLISMGLSVGALLTPFTMVQAAEVTVTVKDIKRLQGHLLVSLFADKESYDSNKPSAVSRVKVAKAEEVITFADLKDGEYAVKLIHDDNDNKRLDTNMLNIPKEGYGFSNNGGAFGPSPYEEAKFSVKDNTAISITLL